MSGGSAPRSATLAWVALTATLGAGLVGAIRQRREARRIRAGALPRAGAAAVILPSSPEGALARRLATWTPAAPTSALGRVAAMAWASPLTAVGLALGATTGGRARWDDEHGCLVIEGARAGSARLLRVVGAGANAMGHVVVSTYGRTPPVVLAHEAGHVRQAERLGPLLFPVYVWSAARYGYRDNPIERGARLAARRWLDAGSVSAPRP
ncbi:MAG: hypothetical protein KY457_01440 [Actinobacteria bacterium]|nr:hypothetical protein [Actinomycetota bacterium]